MPNVNLKKNQSPHGQVTAVSMMKDEAPFLLEWFAHHMAVGFTDILVYTNDCTDGTDDMLIRLEELGLGYHRRNEIAEGIKPQPSAIKHAQKEPIVQSSDWVMLFDADEFLSVNHGDGSIDGLITAAGDATGIVITWRIFGSSGVLDWSRAPVTEQYLHAAPPLWNKGWGVKTLFKFDDECWKLGIHRPKMKANVLKTTYPDTIQWLNGSGVPMEDYFKFRGWRSIRRTVGFEWAQMNHYAVKSVDSYAVRKFRGNVNLKKDKYNDDYWSLQDRNEVRDTHILRYGKETQRIMGELLKDPILNKLHFAALERVEALLAEYKETPAYADLRSSLIAASNVPITQVSAKPPKARDPAKIAALMSDIEQKAHEASRDKPPQRTPQINQEFYCPTPIDLSAKLPVDVVKNHDVLLPADPRIFAADTFEDVAKGKHQRREARQRSFLLAPTDKLLEIGAGIGFLPIVSALHHPALKVYSFEDRADLCAISRELALKNNVTDQQITFADRDSYSIQDISKFAPTAIAINNIPPYLALQDILALPSLRRVILAFNLGQPKKLVELIAANGFSLNQESERTMGRVFDRKKA